MFEHRWGRFSVDFGGAARSQHRERGRPVLVLRIDATLVEAASGKERAAGHYKGGYGFAPMGGWCSNTGESLAVMLRPGNAGAFTAADQVAVLKASLAQVPARWRRDVLVTIDGAGASHEVIDHLHALNTHREHGRRGRRVEYSIGWPVDERTTGAIARLAATAWTEALTAEGKVDPDAKVAELTGLLRPGGALPDELEGWPKDLRVIARRTKRPEGKPAQLGQDVNFEYGAFATNTVGGQLQHLDARHRTQAHVEDAGLADHGVRGPEPALGQLPAQRRLARPGRPRLDPDLLAAADRRRRLPSPPPRPRRCATGSCPHRPAWSTTPATAR